MKSFTRVGFVIVGLVLACAAAVCAAQSATGEVEKQVLAVEKARTTALEHSDIAALQRLMADDVTYVHSSAHIDTKTSYLAALSSGQLHYISFQPIRLHVRVYGETAVIDGEYAVRVLDLRTQKDPFNLNLLFLTMYARRNGRWQQIAWQSTRDTVTPPAN